MAAPTGGSTSAAPATPAPSASPSDVRQSIFEAVDGVGVKPGLESWSEETSPRNKKQAQKLSAVPQPSPQGEAPRAQVTEQVADPVHPDIAKYFETELGIQPQGAEALEGEQPAEANPQLDALTQRAAQAEQVAQQATQALSQMQSTLQQMQQGFQQTMQKVQVENAELRAGLKYLLSGQQKQNQQPLDPVAEFEQNLLNRQVDPRLQKAITPLQREIQQLRQHIQQREQQAQTESNKQRYLSEASSAARDILFAGFDQGELSPELVAEAEEDILGLAWGQRTDIKNAAKILRQRTFRRALSFIKAQARMQGAQQAKTQELPGNMPKTNMNAAAGGEPEPDNDLLLANGFKRYMDWDFAGRPPLQPKKRSA